MMMMADGNIFGTIPTNTTTTPLKELIRQPLVTPRTTLEAPNAFTGESVGGITQAEIPPAFRGGVMGSGNTLLAAQQFQAMAPLGQPTFGGGGVSNQYKFSANTTTESYVTEKGSANAAKDTALKSGNPSGEIVTKARASYTGT